jgi:hypothetical protein
VPAFRTSIKKSVMAFDAELIFVGVFVTALGAALHVLLGIGRAPIIEAPEK